MPADAPSPEASGGSRGEVPVLPGDLPSLTNSSFGPETCNPPAQFQVSDLDSAAALDAASAKVEALFGPKKPIIRKRPGDTSASSQAKRESILKMVEAGRSIGESLAELGISQKSHEYYRRTDPQYKARIDVARTLQNKSMDRGWTGDSASFNETFFPQEFPTPGFHHEILRTLKSAKPGTITLINCFPNSGKSTLIENFICETLAVDPQHRFVIASKAQNHARKMLSTVKDRMTNVNMYPAFIGRFGPFYQENQERAGRPWTTDYITVWKNDKTQRDYSVQTMGWSGQILGSRVDTIILDDIQTGDNLSQVDEMLRKFRQDFYTRLKGGRIIIIGNRIDNGDFYERLLELDIIDPANHHDYPAVDHEGNTLWPDRWPMEELDLMRKVVGEKIWWTTYQQKPQLAGNATFSEDLLDKAKDWGRKVSSHAKGEPTLLSIDPGLNPGVTAIVALQYGTDWIKVIDAEKHTDFSQQEQIIDLIEAYAIRYAPQHVVIEVNAFQRALERDDRLQALSRKYGFLTHPHQSNRNKSDPVMGVAAMASSFIREEITFPWEGGPGSVSVARMEPLLAELAAWRPNIPTKLLTQDFVMALWFGWKYLLEQRHGMGIATDAWNRGGLPWKQTSTPWVRAKNAWSIPA